VGVRETLCELGVRPSKSLGQDFLINREKAWRIVSALDVSPGGCVLEIGPGLGALTEILLLERDARVYAVEVSFRLSKYLERTFGKYEGFSLYCMDFRKFDIASLPEGTKVLGNIPYRITGEIVRKLLVEGHNRLGDIVLGLQEEVAMKMIASPGDKDWGSFSVLVQFYTEPEVLFGLGRMDFYPVPKVNSKVVKLRFKEGELPAPPERFFPFVGKLFSARRKMLRNVLRYVEKDRLSIVKQKVDLTRRPDTLSLSELVELFWLVEGKDG